MSFVTTLHEVSGGRLLAEGVLSDVASLNALSPQMLQQMRAALAAWREDERIVLVVLRGEGRHFCAGGNIREITQKIRAQQWDDVAAFFHDEYALDATLYAYPKPVLAWGSGAVMGGGMGVLQGCSVRVLAEDVKVAMPEVHIGLFPDVGAAWFLRRCPPPLGLFLGLCGPTLNAQDALFANLADCVLPADGREALMARLLAAEWSGDAESDLTQARQIAEAGAVEATAAASPLAGAMAEIAPCCVADNAAEIFSALAQVRQPWIEVTLARAASASPGAVVFWQRHWQALDGATRAEVFAADYRAMLAFAKDERSEFVEGVRALVIDKDKSPSWQHKDFASVPANWPVIGEEDVEKAAELQAEIEGMG